MPTALGDDAQGARSQLFARALTGDLAAGGHRDGAGFHQYDLIDTAVGGFAHGVLHRRKQRGVMRRVDELALRLGDDHQFLAAKCGVHLRERGDTSGANARLGIGNGEFDVVGGYRLRPLRISKSLSRPQITT